MHAFLTPWLGSCYGFPSRSIYCLPLLWEYRLWVIIAVHRISSEIGMHWCFQEWHGAWLPCIIFCTGQLKNMWENARMVSWGMWKETDLSSQTSGEFPLEFWDENLPGLSKLVSITISFFTNRWRTRQRLLGTMLQSPCGCPWAHSRLGRTLASSKGWGWLCSPPELTWCDPGMATAIIRGNFSVVLIGAAWG